MDHNTELMPTDAAGQWQEELDRNLHRIKNFSELVTDRSDPPVGCSPREEIYRKHKARLYRYGGGGAFRTPILFVPNLGIP